MADDTSPDNNDATPASPTTSTNPSGIQWTPQRLSAPVAPSLADTLFGTDRVGLNASVRNSQVQNGLRSAQTEVAIQNAAKAQREAQSTNDIGPAVEAATGNKDYGALAGVLAKSGNLKDIAGLFGGYENMAKALAAHRITDNPAELQNAQGTADLGVMNPAGLQHAQTDQGQILTQPGQAVPTVTQTAGSRATQASQHAQANKANAAQGPVDQNETKYLGYQLFNGKPLPSLGNGQAATAQRNAAYQEAARLSALSQTQPDHPDLHNPGFDQQMQNGQDFIGSQRTVNNAAGGLMSRQTTALNNSVGHLQLIEQLNTALHNGDIGAISGLANKVKTAFGLSTAPTSVQTAASVLGPELNKALVGSGAGAEDERANFSRLVNGVDQNPENMTAAIETLKQMFGRQASDLQIQYKGGTKRDDFGKRYFAPDVAQYLGIQDGQQHVGPSGSSPAPIASAPAAAAAPAAAPAAPAAPAGGAAFVSKATYDQLVAKVGETQAQAILKSKGAMVQ